MWRGGGRPNISVAASFVWRCLTGSTVTPFPHPAHRTGRADLPHPALGQDLTPLLSRATPSAVLEHSSELIGCPISMSITTYCVCPELRPLPSTGITRLQRYYEPLRHPMAPGLSLAGFQLVVALTTPWGFPCCVRFPCVHAAATTPAQRLGVPLRSFTQPCQPSPKGSSGRPAHCPFRDAMGRRRGNCIHRR
jgi:hypothetical protein